MVNHTEKLSFLNLLLSWQRCCRFCSGKSSPALARHGGDSDSDSRPTASRRRSAGAKACKMNGSNDFVQRKKHFRSLNYLAHQNVHIFLQKCFFSPSKNASMHASGRQKAAKRKRKRTSRTARPQSPSRFTYMCSIPSYFDYTDMLLINPSLQPLHHASNACSMNTDTNSCNSLLVCLVISALRRLSTFLIHFTRFVRVSSSRRRT